MTSQISTEQHIRNNTVALGFAEWFERFREGHLILILSFLVLHLLSITDSWSIGMGIAQGSITLHVRRIFRTDLRSAYVDRPTRFEVLRDTIQHPLASKN
jgi:hypothetical protein